MPPSIKPTPPLVTDCLAVPEGRYTAPPKPDAVLTAEWAKRMWSWANTTLGIATVDRTQWAGERACVRAKADTGAVR